MQNDSAPNTTHKSSTPIRSRSRDAQEQEGASAVGIVFRLGWLVVGPLCMVGYLMHLGRHDPPLISLMSLGFWALVAAIIIVRYIDVQKYDGETTNGVTATMKDFRGYVVRLLAAGGVAWAAVAFI